MAIKKMAKDGYGQIELNHVAWRRDGRIEAQSALDTDDFTKENPAENGTLMAVDFVNRKLLRALPAHVGVYPIGVNYSSETSYDDRTPGLKDFSLAPGDILPRIGYPAIGDKFTINAIAYDSDDFADDEALETAFDAIKTTPLYAGLDVGAGGYLTITTTAPATGPVFKVVEPTTMPDGQLAVKIQCIRA